jgi:lyso-ornithine lipid O-acyltransferase
MHDQRGAFPVGGYDSVARPSGWIKAFIAVVAILLVVVLLGPVQWLLDRFNLPGRRWLPLFFHRVVLLGVGCRVSVSGEPERGRPLLLVSNHVSWLDIPVLGSLFPLHFVAKSEIAGWPVAGSLARLQRTVFVDRNRRQKTGAVGAEMAERMNDGDPVVLFPEGTTGDGNRLLPFRSALIGGVREAMVANGSRIAVQPVAIAYARRDGLPIGRTGRAQIAWYGDMTLLPHVMGILSGGPIQVSLTFGTMRWLDAETDRKAMSRMLEDETRALVMRGLSGYPLGLTGSRSRP